MYKALYPAQFQAPDRQREHQVETVHETGGKQQGQLASDRRGVIHAGVYVALVLSASSVSDSPHAQEPGSGAGHPMSGL